MGSPRAEPTVIRPLAPWLPSTKAWLFHSELINCSASEATAMIEGAVRHATMKVEGNYVDSHGHVRSRLRPHPALGFDLLPRSSGSIR